MSQLGRIGGQVLADNLLRAGVDLAVETNLLYLDVANKKIGIKKSPPIYDLDVNGNIKNWDLTVDHQLAVGNIRINNGNTLTTSVGGISVYINGSEIFHDRLTTANLEFNGNQIASFSNSNIIFDPHGSGAVNLLANTNITGSLHATGNIRMDGDLTGLGTLTLGDQVYDTVTINTDFSGNITLTNTDTYTLGTPSKRWNAIYQTDSYGIGTLGDSIHTSYVIVSDQTKIFGPTATITTLQTNDELFLIPDSGTTYLEDIKINTDEITTTNDILFNSTGTGYYLVEGNNGVVIPYGADSERGTSPVVGETRFNTERGYLECFDGNVWAISTGGGIEVTQELMTDIGNIWTLVLG